MQDVSWIPPTDDIVKVNCDGYVLGSSSGAIEFVFRDSHANFLGGFSQNIGYASPLEAEFSACMEPLRRLNNFILPTFYWKLIPWE